MNKASDFLAADWPAPPPIRAGATLRTGGVSEPPYASLNLGAHTDDAPEAVAENRRRLRAALELPAEPAWLDQVHGATVIDLDHDPLGPADAAITRDPDRVPAILTADCLPVVFCDRAGTCWGAAHAGWRGLAGGLLEATVAALPASADNLMAWLGPAIGPANFEVGAEVRSAFVGIHAEDHVAFREAARPGKFLADIYALAQARLSRAGVASVHGGGHCTIDEPCFHSHRRDRGRTGRQATLVWRAR